MCLKRFGFIVLLVYCNICVAFSQKIYLLSDDLIKADPNIKKQLYYFKDSTNQLPFHTVLKKPFKEISGYFESAYDTSCTYWFRLEVKNNSSLSRQWVLEVMDFHVNNLQFFRISSADTVVYNQTGLFHSFSTRPLIHKNFNLPFYIDYKNTAYIFLRYKHWSKSSLTISIRPTEKLLEYATSEYYFLGFFYGMVFIMALYNLFIYFFTREKIYLFYVFYVVLYTFNSFSTDGIGFQYLWPESPSINKYVDGYSLFLLTIAVTIYSIYFLYLPRLSQKLTRFTIYSLLIYAALFLLNQSLVKIQYKFFYLIPAIGVFLAGVAAVRKGNVSARFFLVAYSFFVVCFTIAMLKSYRFIPTSIYTIYALNFGFLVEVFIFSFGMGHRLREEKSKKELMDQALIAQLKENEKLKDNLNKELEQKVAERTKEVIQKNEQLADAFEELQMKNRQIELLNGFLQKDNVQLNENIKEINKARLMLKDLTLEEFQNIYPNEESCLGYLSQLKWEKGFRCKKCGCSSYYQGKLSHSRRCTECSYDESPTSFTFFHNSKMPITTSFYLVYLILNNKDISSYQLSEKLGIRQKTCWAYKRKILEACEKKGKIPLDSKQWGKILFNI